MSLFKMHEAIIDRLDLRRNFLCEGQGEKRRLYLVKWLEIVRLNSQGGLRIVILRIETGHCILNGREDFGKKRVL